MRGARISHAAERDLADLLTFVADRDGVDGADSVLDEFQATFERLVVMPRVGRLRPHLSGSHTRWTRVYDWLVLYEPTNDGILVLRVIHGRRDVDRLLRD